MLLIIDNYDSFTHNLARYFIELGQNVRVERNDQISCEQIADLAPQYLVISPGPCTPNEAGISLEVIKRFAGIIPILGVCLGHQAIAQVFGGRIIRAQNVKHGKTSTLAHLNSPLFKGVSQPFMATRYHSLLLEEASLPEELQITAWCQEAGFDREIMAIEHKTQKLAGLQFHPESLLTTEGLKILANFIKYYI